MITPTSFHRLRFRKGDKEQIIRTSNRLILAGIVCLAVAMVVGGVARRRLLFIDRRREPDRSRERCDRGRRCGSRCRSGVGSSTGDRVRVAICQMRSDDDVERNLALAERLLTEAADGRCRARHVAGVPRLHGSGRAAGRGGVAGPRTGDRSTRGRRSGALDVGAGRRRARSGRGRPGPRHVGGARSPGVRSSRPTGRSISTTSSCPTSRRSASPTRSPPATRS